MGLTAAEPPGLDVSGASELCAMFWSKQGKKYDRAVQALGETPQSHAFNGLHSMNAVLQASARGATQR